MVGKYKVITLCGSTKFKEQYLEAQKRLTLEELDALITPTRDYTISEIRHLLSGVYLDIRVDIVPE